MVKNTFFSSSSSWHTSPFGHEHKIRNEAIRLRWVGDEDGRVEGSFKPVTCLNKATRTVTISVKHSHSHGNESSPRMSIETGENHIIGLTTCKDLCVALVAVFVSVSVCVLFVSFHVITALQTRLARFRIQKTQNYFCTSQRSHVEGSIKRPHTATEIHGPRVVSVAVSLCLHTVYSRLSPRASLAIKLSSGPKTLHVDAVTRHRRRELSPTLTFVCIWRVLRCLDPAGPPRPPCHLETEHLQPCASPCRPDMRCHSAVRHDLVKRAE